MKRGRRWLRLKGRVILRPGGFVRVPMVPSDVPRLVRRGALLFLVVREDRVFPDFGRFNLAVVDYVPHLDGRLSIRLVRRWLGGGVCSTDGVEPPF